MKKLTMLMFSLVILISCNESLSPENEPNQEMQRFIESEYLDVLTRTGRTLNLNSGQVSNQDFGKLLSIQIDYSDETMRSNETSSLKKVCLRSLMKTMKFLAAF